MGAALAAAAGDVGGGLLNYFSQQRANEINQANFQQNLEFQQELAHHGLQWKMADAEAAGINPIYAVGAGAGGGSPVAEVQASSNNALGDTVRGMGQDISRAIDAKASAADRERKDMMDAVNLEHAKLGNDLLRVQISNAVKNQPRNSPMPTDGSSSAPGLVDVLKHSHGAGWDFLRQDAPKSDMNLKEAFESMQKILSNTYHGIHIADWLKRIQKGYQH